MGFRENVSSVADKEILTWDVSMANWFEGVHFSSSHTTPQLLCLES